MGTFFGLSTENIFWGPSIRNSIMMSNNAPGFPHLTFNTQKPIKTAIGTFEGQIATARLEGSGHLPPQSTFPFFASIRYRPKPDDWRYFQGGIITYSPKWLKGLSLGFTRWVQQYYQVARETNDYFPLFQISLDKTITIHQEVKSKGISSRSLCKMALVRYKLRILL